MPSSMLDATETWPPTPRRAEIERSNRAHAEDLRRLVLPSAVRTVYPAYRVDAGPPKLPDLVVDVGGERPESRVATLASSRGTLLLRDLCPPSLVEHLQPDPGLRAFTRRPEREHAILERVASSGHGAVAVAHTESGNVVSQVVLTPAEDWWRDLPVTYEISVETSTEWRRMGVAQRLLEFCFEPAWTERLIVLAMGLDWHWDLDGAGLDATGYRDMLRRLFERVGFHLVRTSEPNVAMHASNLLLARVGAQVLPARRAAFEEALFIAPWQRTVG
jgi:acetoin utilization protein AcuA